MNTKEKRNMILSLIINIAVIAMELIGLFQSVGQHGHGIFLFYTEDSNLLALAACTILALFEIGCLVKGGDIPKWAHMFKYVSTCCVAVTLIVVLTVLAPAYGAEGYRSMMLSGSMLYHHFLCPVFAIIGFVFFEHKPALGKNHALIALIPTIIYAIVATLLNILRVIEGPYPFLFVYKQPVYMSCIWFVIIVGGAYLIAWLVGFCNTKAAKISGKEFKA